MNNNTAIIILAAGDSSRLGQPKQLIEFKGKTLIAHVTEAATAVTDRVLVLTGYEKDAVASAILQTKAAIIYNPLWEQGMGAGISAGIRALPQDCDAVIIAVCDQPFISSAVFSSLINKHAASGKGIIACTYADATGTPVLFHKKYFSELLHLGGNEGAKSLVSKYSGDVDRVAFIKGEIDIDVVADLGRLSE